MIPPAVGSSTIFRPNIIPKSSGSRLAYRLIDPVDSGTILPVQYRDVPFSKGSGSSTIRDPIVSLPNNEYHVLQPIPVVYERSIDGWIAWFEHAGIGMSGTTRTEARELLSHDILDAFILYTEEEEKLGPGPIAQLKVLRSYIIQGNDHYQE